jgi:hypothetical protein
LWFAESGGYGQGRPVPPGVREADKQSNAPVEPPVKIKEKGTDSAALKREADELAQLSAGIPADVTLLAQGQIQKDLSDKLKRIEKLAKHLRSEVTP